MKHNEDTDVLEKVDEETDVTNNLIVYNDEVNSFEHVIITLMKVCKHSAIQAEQCTLLIHNKGKCAVKNGSLPDLIPLKFAINDAGINAEIE